MRRRVAWLALGAYLGFLVSGPLHAVRHHSIPTSNGVERPASVTHRGCSCCAHLRFVPDLLGDAPSGGDGEDLPREPTPDTPAPRDGAPCPVCQVVVHGFVEMEISPPLPSVPAWVGWVGCREASLLTSPMRAAHRARAPPAG